MLLCCILPLAVQAQKKTKTSQEAVEQLKQNVETLKGLFKKKNKGTAENKQPNEKSEELEVPLAVTDVQLAVGYYHTLTIVDGVLYGWGDNTQGQLGLGMQSKEYNPKQIGTASDWEVVAAAFYHSLAIKKDGSLWAWGWGNGHEMGLGQQVSKVFYPSRVGADNDWWSVSTAQDNTVALKKDGSLWVWGSNVNACLGVGKTVNSAVYVPTRVGTDTDWVSAIAGQHVILGIKKNGSLWVWGRKGGSNILGLRTVNEVVPVPTQIGTDTDWDRLYVHNRHGGAAVFALKKDGSVWVWGSNRSGRLGTGDEENRPYPERINLNGSWRAYAFNDRYTLALRADGTLWHSGDYRQVTDTKIGDEWHSTVFKRLNLNDKWVAIRMGMNFTALVDQQGSIWTYGNNASGQLGWGNKEGSMTPVKVPLPAAVKAAPQAPVLVVEKDVLSEGANVLFSTAKTTLSIGEKNSIYMQLGFTLAVDRKRFVLGEEAKDYPFEAYVFPTDLNGDGLEELFILYGNAYTAGMTGTNIIAFVKEGEGMVYRPQLGFPGTLPDALETVSEGWPDLVIGGPGFEFPVWRWDGKEYSYHRKISSADLVNMQTENIENISKGYVNR